MSFKQREPYAPFLDRLPAPEDCESEVKLHIEEISEEIEKIKTSLKPTGEWTEKWEKFVRGEFVELVRKIDESLPLVENQSIKSRKQQTIEIFKTPKAKELLQEVLASIRYVTNEHQRKLDPQVPKLQHLVPTTKSGGSSSSSSENKKELKEVIKHEEELQQRAEEEKERDPGEFILHQTYDDLEHQLKQCLLCFAVFPSNQVIKKRTIIYWWIGEGLVSASRDGRTAEQVGEDCFRMLIACGLIQPIYQKLSRTANYCKIYPWVRKMLVSKAKEADFFFFDESPKDDISSSGELPEGPRASLNHEPCKRACLLVSNGKEKESLPVPSEGNENKEKESKAEKENKEKENKVHECLSLFNYNEHYLSCVQLTLEKFKAMATLQLGRWQNLSSHDIEVDNDSFLKGLQFLTRLKYLSLHGISRITELPDSIAKLTNLLILDLRSCHNLESVTTGVTSLSSLTHLDVSGCYLLDKMPRGIRSMSNLQVLKGFVVGGARSKDPCPLRELTALQNLRKLSIRIGSEAQVDNDLIELSNIKSLRSLRITWGQVKTKSEEGLKSPSTISFPDLTKLALECVPNDKSVSWLKPGKFGKVERLYIEGGKLTELSLVDNNQKWNIEILRLKFLKELKLNCAGIEKPWTDKELLPQLRGAQIIDCPKIDIALHGFDEKGIWEWSRQEANSSSMARPVQAGDRTEASSSSSSNSTVS